MLARRYRVIALGAVLAIAGAMLPLAVMAYVSWQIAIGKELEMLTETGERAVLRAEQTLSEAWQVLRNMEASSSSRCSPSHIALMRLSTVNADAVSEIGYFADGLLKCTSWGPVVGDVPRARADYTMDNGIEVRLRLQPSVSLGKTMMALHMGSHNVLIAPSRFTDIVLSPNLSVAILNDRGNLMNSRNKADIIFARQHATGKASGIDGDKMFAAVTGKGVVAVIAEPTSMIYGRLRSEMLLLLPVGLFISAFIVGIVIFMSKRRLSPRAELEIAVQKREFVVHYQPIIDLESHVCVGAEALVRWRRPSGTLVRPDLFIPLAEETGLIKPITDLVVDAIIRDLGPLLVEDRGLHVAVNLCADDIRTGRFIDMLAEKLSGTGIRNEQIFLEATERGFVNIDAARQTLTRARAAGHTVAIDDFGTGYSSLQYLQGLPMDALKIDKTFIDTIGRGTATSSVTPHIIDMARELGLLSVAEGVETQEQADYLRKHGVGYGQGWLFSRPVDPQSFIAFHKASRAQYGPAPEIIRAAA